MGNRGWMLLGLVVGCEDADGDLSAAAQSALAEEGVAETRTQGEIAAFLLAVSADLSDGDGSLVTWTPEDCLTVTERRAVTTYTFAGCVGSYGGVVVSGDITVERGASMDGTLTYTIASYDLTLNATAVVLASTITYSLADESLSTETAVSTAALSYTAAAAVHIDAAGCRVVDGVWQLARDEQSLWLEVAGLTHCGADTCTPTEGSLRAHRGDPASAVTLTFTGADTVAWSGASGAHSGEVTLPCDKP